jgi:hypothetical protein
MTVVLFALVYVTLGLTLVSQTRRWVVRLPHYDITRPILEPPTPTLAEFAEALRPKPSGLGSHTHTLWPYASILNVDYAATLGSQQYNASADYEQALANQKQQSQFSSQQAQQRLAADYQYRQANAHWSDELGRYVRDDRLEQELQKARNSQ